jgi:hypothetical protein
LHAIYHAEEAAKHHAADYEIKFVPEGIFAGAREKPVLVKKGEAIPEDWAGKELRWKFRCVTRAVENRSKNQPLPGAKATAGKMWLTSRGKRWPRVSCPFCRHFEADV